MNKNVVLLVVLMCLGGYGMAQKNINNYKYVVIPLKYNFLSENDQYRINTLTRHLFKTEGFETLFEVEDFPEDLKKDRCKALYVNVDKVKGGFLSTRLEINLSDCRGKEVYRSNIGSSKEKEYKKAYPEALRKAFVSIHKLNYKYEAIETSTDVNKITGNGGVTNDDELEDVEREDDRKISTKTEAYDDTYYAQPKKNGYQLVDSEPKVVMFLLSTTAKNVFIVKGKDAIVYKENGFWYYSENNGELKEPKILNIKF